MNSKHNRPLSKTITRLKYKEFNTETVVNEKPTPFFVKRSRGTNRKSLFNFTSTFVVYLIIIGVDSYENKFIFGSLQTWRYHYITSLLFNYIHCLLVSNIWCKNSLIKKGGKPFITIDSPSPTPPDRKRVVSINLLF